MDQVGLKLSTMRDTDLCIQDDRSSWKELIEGDDHRLTKAVSRALDQRRNGYLILPWTEDRHLLEAFGSTLMAEVIQATHVYYSAVDGFLTGDPLLLNLRHVAGHIQRELDMYVFLVWENVEACVDILMNGHWEELIGKGEELLHATDDPDNYYVHIQEIIRWSSDGRQHLESLLRLYVIKCVQGVIKAMSSSSASGCALALVDLRQRLAHRAEWIFGWTVRSVVDEAFDQVLRDHPDLHDAVKAQVSVLCQSFK